MKMVGFAGLTEMAVRVGAGAATVRVVEPAIELRFALIVVDPTDAAVARPVMETVATAGLEDVQVTELVKSWLLPSL